MLNHLLVASAEEYANTIIWIECNTRFTRTVIFRINRFRIYSFVVLSNQGTIPTR